MQSLQHRTVSTCTRQGSHRRSAPTTIREPLGAPSAGAASEGVEPHLAFVFRVLGIDGGGVRGIIQARILIALEDAARRPIAEPFDLIVGTSIGGIAALALIVPGTNGSPIYTPDSAATLLAGHKDAIFPPGDLSVPRTITQVRQLPSTMARTGLAATGRHRGRGNARYSPEPLEEALSGFFGDVMLSEAITPVVVTAFDTLTDRPIHFRSEYAANLGGCDIPMATVARAATATPTFFPPLGRQVGRKAHGAADAGVYAGDVSLLAYSEARTHAAAQGRSPDEIRLVLLGFGREYGSPDSEIDGIVRRHGVSLADRLMKAAEIGHQETHRRLLGDLLQGRYWRFQPPLPDGSGFGTDDPSDEQLAGLISIAVRFVANHSNEIRHLVEHLIFGAGRQDRMSELAR